MDTNKISDDEHKKYLKNLILTMYDGNAFGVGNMLDVYKKTLESKNIEQLEMQKLYNLFYAVRDELVEQGVLRKLKHGVFYASTQGVEDYPEPDESLDENNEEEYADDVLSSTIVVGEGTTGGEVYVYYYKTYEEYARIMGYDRFRLKVGMTTRGCKKRFASSTDCPEQRYVALIIKTDKPLELERLIHSALRLAGRQAICAGNSEWFNSNIEEILEIYNKYVA